jgi:hypothetical protein
MDKQFILEQIRRTAKASGGVALGKARFLQETGIREADWFGKFWSRWGDAVLEAGCTPNTLQSPFDEQELLEKFTSLIRELQRFPVKGELQLKRQADPTFPNDKVFTNRFGLRKQFVTKLLGFCEAHPGYDDVAEICIQAGAAGQERPRCEPAAESVVFGSVYMLRSGKFHKVGQTMEIGRRMYELKIQLPEKAQVVHVIQTDDPKGIEEYWHRRFAAKRVNSEWFNLEPADIATFKRRKFM